MIAECLRACARWRIDRAEPDDAGRNARAAVGLLDAASFVLALDEGDRIIIRLTVVGCFLEGHFDPGAEGERLIREWKYHDRAGRPADLLERIAAALEGGTAAGLRPSHGRARLG